MEAGSSAEVVLEVADPVDPADRYAVGALVRAALPRPQRRRSQGRDRHRKGVIDDSDYLITVVGGMPRLG